MTSSACPIPRSGTTAVGFAAGQTRLAKALAEGLDVRRGVRVSALRRIAGGVEIADEQGNGHGAAAAAIVTAPGPQAAALLEASGEPERAAAVADAEYDAAVCVLTEVAGEPEDRRPVIPGPAPLAAVSLEWRKRPGPRAVVARLDGPASAALLDAPDGDVLDVVLPILDAMLGVRPVAWTQVKRWRYALPVRTLDASLAAVGWVADHPGGGHAGGTRPRGGVAVGRRCRPHRRANLVVLDEGPDRPAVGASCRSVGEPVEVAARVQHESVAAGRARDCRGRPGWPMAPGPPRSATIAGRVESRGASEARAEAGATAAVVMGPRTAAVASAAGRRR